MAYYRIIYTVERDYETEVEASTKGMAVALFQAKYEEVGTQDDDILQEDFVAFRSIQVADDEAAS